MSDPVDAPPATNGDSFEAAKNNVASAYDSVSNGPVAQNIKEHTAKASAELFLAATRKTPAKPAATGQSLTHYHSFFSELLSWKNPRASAIAYASIVSLIFAARYLDVIRYAFKLSWMSLAVTVSAEAVVARSTLDNMIGDVHELVNFFVIEGQRILFAENIGASAAACIATFTFYHLAKLVPYWGLAVIGTTVAFMVPLVYTSNQELIDHHIKNASHVISTQTAQVRDVAQKQAGHLTSMGKQYAGDYIGKVQEMIRGRASSPEATTKPAPATQDLELPSPPTGDPLRATEPKGKIPEAPVMKKQEPLITT